jgi:pimeloyl-ACP methyl ester carboxylesterase
VSFTPAHRGGSGEPLVLLHGFTDTWRTWELVLPALEARHEVLAPTLPGHAGGPPLPDELAEGSIADAVEAAMDEAGFATAHLAGNSLGGYVALQLAARGRACSVVALAPAGGWAAGDPAIRETLDHFPTMQRLLETALPHLDTIAGTEAGRARATRDVVADPSLLTADLVAHQLLGAHRCAAVEPLVALALRDGWPLDAERVDCPVRIVWGSEDRLLEWPRAAARWQRLLPHADWVVLDGVGHCPQLERPLETAQLILGVSDRG